MKIQNGNQPAVNKVDKTQIEQQKIKKIAVQFESLLMNTMLKTMRSTIQSSSLIDNDGEIRHYREMLDTEYSNALAGNGSGLGIADMIIEQYATPPVSTAGSGTEMLPIPENRIPIEKAISAYHDESGKPLRQIALDTNYALADTLDKYSVEIDSAAKSTGLRPELILAVIDKESAGKVDALSSKGAAGLMQLMPETAKEVGVIDLLDPAQNITGGAKYLSKMLDRFDGNLELALAGYNAGPGNVERSGNTVPNFPETENYVRRVQSTYKKLCNDVEISPQKKKVM